MIKAEANNGMVSLEMGGLCTEWAEEVLSIITATYSGFEETEKGAGDRLLGAISEAIREGKIQEWSKEAGSLACLGCGHEHNCSTRGCAIIREAADQLEQGTHKKRIAIDRQALIDLIIDAKRTDPETGSFTEWLDDYLIEHLSITQPNEPLTWHELGSMSGKPVYIVYPEEKMGEWALVRSVRDASALFTSAIDPSDYGDRELYGETWLAYLCPPEMEALNNETD